MTAPSPYPTLLAGIRRLAALALTDEGDVQATLKALLRNADADTAPVFTAQAAAALEARGARAAARLDPLTGVLNHGAMHQALREEVSRAVRKAMPLSCLMLDVDHFKAVNDRHGHGTGDELLRRVAHALVTASRPYDRVCRYGGDEFVVLLPAVDLDEAGAAAERIRGEVARTVEGFTEPGLRLAASVGVAEWRPGESPEALLEAADRALLEAKRQGRDGVHGAARRFSRDQG